MEVIEKLGINGKILLAQMVNFFLLLYVLKRLLFKPVMKVLKEREMRIRKGIEDSEKAEIKLKEVREGVEEKLNEARKEADKILAKAYREGEEQKEDMLRLAKEEITALREAAASDIKKEKENLILEVRRETGALIIEMAKRILPRKIGEKEEREWVEEISKEMKEEAKKAEE